MSGWTSAIVGASGGVQYDFEPPALNANALLAAAADLRIAREQSSQHQLQEQSERELTDLTAEDGIVHFGSPVSDRRKSETVVHPLSDDDRHDLEEEPATPLLSRISIASPKKHRRQQQERHTRTNSRSQRSALAQSTQSLDAVRLDDSLEQPSTDSASLADSLDRNHSLDYSQGKYRDARTVSGGNISDKTAHGRVSASDSDLSTATMHTASGASELERQGIIRVVPLSMFAATVSESSMAMKSGVADKARSVWPGKQTPASAISRVPSLLDQSWISSSNVSDNEGNGAISDSAGDSLRSSRTIIPAVPTFGIVPSLPASKSVPQSDAASSATETPMDFADTISTRAGANRENLRKLAALQRSTDASAVGSESETITDRDLEKGARFISSHSHISSAASDSDITRTIKSNVGRECAVVEISRDAADQLGTGTDVAPGTLVCVQLLSLDEAATAPRISDLTSTTDGSIQSSTEDEKDLALGIASVASSYFDEGDDMQTTAQHEHVHNATIRNETKMVVLSHLSASDGHDIFSEDFPAGSFDNFPAENDFVSVAAMPLASMQDALNELRRRGTSNSRSLGLLFLLLFIAFNSVQGLIVSVDVQLGTAVMFTFYASGVIGALLVGPVVARLSTLFVLRASWLAFVIFLASMIVPIFWVVVTTAAIVGIAAALLWTTQSLYISENSDTSTREKNNGVFGGFYTGNFVVASTTAGLLLTLTDATVQHLFAAGTVIGFISFALSFTLKEAAFSSKQKDTAKLARELVILQVAAPVIDEFLENHAAEASAAHDQLLLGAPLEEGLLRETKSTLQSKQKGFFAMMLSDVLAMVRLHWAPSARNVVPFWFFSGLFYAGIFGPMAKLLPLKIVGFGLATFGLFSMFSSFSFAWLIGNRKLIVARTALFIGAGFQFVALALMFVASLVAESSDIHSYVLTFVAYGLMGLSDGGIYPNLTALMPVTSPENTPIGYTLFRVHRSLANCVTFLLMSLVGWRARELALLQFGALLVAVMFMVWNGKYQ